GGALAGFLSSTGANGSAAGPFEPAPATDLNSQDHGTTSGTLGAGGVVLANPVTLAVVGSASNPDSVNGVANNANLHQDLGFFQPLSLGDFVFNDVNNDGSFGGADTGIVGVPVALLDGSGNPILGPGNVPITTTTDGTGHYLFTDLVPGTYRVA